jgi:hypothetical protein
MASGAAKTTRLVNVIAVGVGVFVMFLALLFARFFMEILGVGPREAWLVSTAVVFVAYAGAGAFFGLMWPAKSWRWGVWVSLLPFVWASFTSPFVVLALAGMVVLPACAGALAAARRQHRRDMLRLNRAGSNFYGW